MAIEVPESPRSGGEISDLRMFSPAASRNIEPIAAILDKIVPKSGVALELASGSGEHIVHFAKQFPDLRWQPSDVCQRRLASIRAWKQKEGPANLNAPIFVDASEPDEHGTSERYAVVICINLLHLVSIDVTHRILSRMARSISESGFVFLYGPFRRGARFSSDGDRSFHEHLVAQDPSVGLKDVQHVTGYLRDKCELDSVTIPMPANNLAIVASRAGTPLVLNIAKNI